MLMSAKWEDTQKISVFFSGRTAQFREPPPPQTLVVYIFFLSLFRKFIL